jgi:hypothetical protein
MDTRNILTSLIAERKRIDQAIVALEALNSAPKQATGRGRRHGGMSAAARKRMSQMMKARWAARRKTAGKGKS